MKNIKLNIAIILIILIPGIILGIKFIGGARTGGMVNVEVNGQKVAEFSLDEDMEYLIQGVDGTNKLIINAGSASVVDATCPDKLCEKMGRVDKDGQSIVCLPNKVVVTVVSEEKSEFDTMAQ